MLIIIQISSHWSAQLSSAQHDRCVTYIIQQSVTPVHEPQVPSSEWHLVFVIFHSHMWSIVEMRNIQLSGDIEFPHKLFFRNHSLTTLFQHSLTFISFCSAVAGCCCFLNPELSFSPDYPNSPIRVQFSTTKDIYDGWVSISE